MPKDGWKSITVSETLYNEIQEKADAQGKSIAKFLASLLEENPPSLESLCTEVPVLE